MKASQISVGGTYLMKVSGNIVPVRVDRITEQDYPSPRFGDRCSITYYCTNLKTRRPCKARSASKFRGEVKQGSDPTSAPLAGAKPTAMIGAPTAVPSPTTTANCDHM
jgi:hypothetical protein